MTEAGVTYVTKMKKNLRCETLEDVMYMTSEGVMEHRVQQVVFTKRRKGGEELKHQARIITYADRKKHKTKLISLLTNDMELSIPDIIEIYRQRWEIELLFKQLKQNFPSQIFLWRERQCHQNSDLGHIDCQFTAHGAAKAYQTQLEFL